MNTPTNYSQNDEQTVILSQFDTPGRFLDVGAFDGRTFSNTHALALNGWTGVLVEPGFEQFSALFKLYKARPDLTLVNALVGTDPSQLRKFYFSQDAVSTTEEDHKNTWASQVEFTPIWLPELPVNELLSKFPGPYDFISVDTEGTTFEILKNLLTVLHANNTLPKLVCAEYSGANRADMVTFCSSLEFAVIHQTGENLIFMRI